MSPGAYRWWEGPLWTLDFETTGADPMTAVPVSVSFSRVEVDGTISDGLSTLINPEQPIPAEVTAVHGITDEMAARGWKRRDIAQTIATVLRANTAEPDPLPLVIFQGCFDWPIFLLEAERFGITDLPTGQPIVDPLLLDRWLDKWRKGLRTLAAISARWGVALTAAHTAEADSVAAAETARAIARAWGPVAGSRHTQYYGKADLYFPGFHRTQRRLYATWRDDVNRYWREKNQTDPCKACAGRDDRALEGYRPIPCAVCQDRRTILRQEHGEWPTGRLALDPTRGYGPQETAAHG